MIYLHNQGQFTIIEIKCYYVWIIIILTIIIKIDKILFSKKLFDWYLDVIFFIIFFVKNVKKFKKFLNVKCTFWEETSIENYMQIYRNLNPSIIIIFKTDILSSISHRYETTYRIINKKKHSFEQYYYCSINNYIQMKNNGNFSIFFFFYMSISIIYFDTSYRI